MSGQLLLAFSVFAMVGAFTPGPNGALIVTSALNFGLQRTLPFVLGVSIGFPLMTLGVGLGFGSIVGRYPGLYTALKYVGALYLLWLAFMIARATPPDMDKPPTGKPLSFINAVLFQWVNVKGLIVAASAVTVYAGIAPFPYSVLLQTVIFFVTTLLGTLSWAFFGASLRYLLRSPRAVRIFNLVMAAALVASLYPVLFGP